MRRTLLSSLLSVCVLGKIFSKIIKGKIWKFSIEGSPSNIRLEGGRFPHEGNIMVDGQPVCDDGFTLINADVACKELGYFGAVSFTQKSRYGWTSPDFIMDNVECNGTESRLLDCQHTKVLVINITARIIYIVWSIAVISCHCCFFYELVKIYIELQKTTLLINYKKRKYL